MPTMPTMPKTPAIAEVVTGSDPSTGPATSSLPTPIPTPGGLAPNDTVIVRAQEVWEDPQPDVLHFRGSFDMRTQRWRILAERATVFGAINEPSRIEVEGAPAKIWLLERDGATEQIYGEARSALYLDAEQNLRLAGEAMLIDGDNRLTSATIEYDLTTERFRAGGNKGVEIVVESAGSLEPD